MNTPAGLLIHRITPLCQLQDLGRTGYQRFGVSRSGAMDPYSLRLANILAGNPQDEVCLEFALAGAKFEVTAMRLHFAFVGNFPVLINGEPFPSNASYTLARGERLEIGASDAKTGTHGYMAVLGGFDAIQQLGSYSTHLRSGIRPGFPGTESEQEWIPAQGRDGKSQRHPQKADANQRHPGSRETTVRDRDLRRGAVLPTKLNEAPLAIEHQLPAELIQQQPDTIRVVPGPQDDQFSAEQTRQFFESRWKIATDSDRMGFRLEGPTIELAEGGSMTSEPVSPGSIQITASGQPIVLMPDCGTVGGYPKIATVISADRGRMAQMRVGAEFRFDEIDVASAMEMLQIEETRLAHWQRRAGYP